MNNTVITILSLSVSGSILALMLFAGKPVLKNRISKAFSYYIWLLVLLRLVVPLAAPINVMDAVFYSEQTSVSNDLPEQTETSVESNADQTTGLPAVTSNTQMETSKEHSGGATADTQTLGEARQTFDLWSFIQDNLLWLWLAGAVVSFGWFSIAYAVFSKRIRHSCTAPHSDDLTVFESLRGRIRVRLFCSSYAMTPMSFGILRPVIVLPERAYVRSGMSDELKNVLRHELTHSRRKDVLYKWLVVMVTSLHWFNPIMIPVRKEISRACELSCDEAVIRNMSPDEKRFYGNMLLSLSAGKKLSAGILATTLCENKKELKERLISIKNYQKKTARAAALSIVLALLLTGCAAALGVVNVTAAPGSVSNILSSDITAEKLLRDGTSISYTMSAENENWIRHVDLEERNDPSYLERFPDVEALQAQYAGHTLFEMPRGVSESVTFYTELGLTEENVDFPPDPQYFRILIINSRIEDVKVLDNQVAVVAEPAESGYQVITLNSDDLPGNTVLFRLIAPDEQEIDSFISEIGSSDSTLAATVPFTNIEPYQAPEVEITMADYSDIASVIVSYVCDDGMEVMFYKAQSGDIFGAYITGNDMVMQFTQGYWADENWGYQNGYDIQPYENVFGHDGFYIACPRGAAYGAYDYYYFEPDGTLKLVIQCCNYVVAQDLNGDGATELLWFYDGGAEAYYCYEIDDTIYAADLDALLTEVLPDWVVSFDPYSVANESIGITYIYGSERENEPATYTGIIKFEEDSLVVYEQPSEVWPVQREDYEVGLRNQGDQTEILLRRDGAVTVLDSVPSNSGSGMRYSLRSFDAIPELSGFVLENLTSYGWGNFYYYAVRNDSAVCFAQSFGGDMTDIDKDLNGDGQAELICNVTYNADGVTDVLVHRMKDGVPQVSSVKDAMLNIPGDKHLARPASAAYDVNTGSVTLEYLIAGEDESRFETAPIDYDSLQFEDFAATW